MPPTRRPRPASTSAQPNAVVATVPAPSPSPWLQVLIGQGGIQAFRPPTSSSSSLAVLSVDTEPKTRPSVLLGTAGCGNNWSTGYTLAPSRVLSAIRSHVERDDTWHGCVVAFSAAGGTGSGVGSRTLVELRDAYPKARLVAATVLPFAQVGETAVAAYNSVLAIATAVESADAVVTLANDHLDLVAGGKGWDAMNAVARAVMDDAILSLAGTRGRADWIPQVCPLAACNVLNVGWAGPYKVYPSQPPDTLAAVKSLCRNTRAVRSEPARPGCIAALLAASDHFPLSPSWSSPLVEKKLATRLFFAPHLAAEHGTVPLYHCEQRARRRPTASLAVVHNSAATVTADLAHVAVSATRRWHARAFLHQYPDSVAQGWIPEACEKVWEVADAYRWVTAPEAG
ncbi:hypothetical protein H9P43_002035 [Blastocladiella emersonii ATCC 22665]|nr:hypothetical protein H9P43_002035 [Blastocladiella emersonii ATCC 22665]